MKEKILSSIMDWNPWFETNFPKDLAGFKREYRLEKYLKFKEIKILEGPRRAGKSTLLYQIIKKIYQKNKNILYINFEDEILKEYPLSEIYYTFLEFRKIEYLFLDEIQNSKNWVPFIRKMYDLKKLKQIWITGSNTNLISREYSTLLTGRNISIEILPLSFKEFLKFRRFSYQRLMSIEKKAQLMSLFKEYLDYGGFPEVVLRNYGKKELLINYYKDFLFKDIISKHKINYDKLNHLTKFLLSNISKDITYRSLSKTLDLNFNTVVDFISYLRESYLIDEINKFDYSLKKQLLNPKKIYSIDTGLANSISFKFSEDKGRLLENLVFIELKRRGKEVYYHRGKKECDFVIKQGLDIIEAIQVTTSLEDPETKKRELQGLIDALKTYNLKQGLILTEDEEHEFIEKDKKTGKEFKIKVMPVWKFLLQ